MRKPPIMKPYDPARKHMSYAEAVAKDQALKAARLKADQAFEEEYKKAMGTALNPELKKAQDELIARKQLVSTLVSQLKDAEVEWKNNPQDTDIRTSVTTLKRKITMAEDNVKKTEALIQKLS